MSGTNGRTVAAKSNPERIEIESSEPRVMVITERDGTRHELHAQLLYSASKGIAFFQRKMGRLQEQMEACDDEEQWMKLLDEHTAAEERMIQLAIPDFPTGLLARLEMSVLAQVREATARMRAQQAAEDEPAEAA